MAQEILKYIPVAQGCESIYGCVGFLPNFKLFMCK